jgi:membrane associated rhomboid family serine protease
MTPWVRRIIVANVVVFVLQYFVPALELSLALVPALVLARPWTIVTYMFVHASFWHILFNMLAFYWFGPRVEERLGGRSFITLYFLSGIAGGLLSFFTPGVPIVGASGAIMGVMVAYARYWPRQRFYFYGLIPVEAWLLALIYVLIDVSGAWGIGGAGIAHYAHLGGAAVGFLYVQLNELLSPARRWRRKMAPSPPPRVFGDGDVVRRWREQIRLDDLHPINREEVLRLLEKAQRLGPKSLTPEERATLERFGG